MPRSNSGACKERACNGDTNRSARGDRRSVVRASFEIPWKSYRRMAEIRFALPFAPSLLTRSSQEYSTSVRNPGAGSQNRSPERDMLRLNASSGRASISPSEIHTTVK
jgi:hypothetical protein